MSKGGGHKRNPKIIKYLRELAESHTHLDQTTISAKFKISEPTLRKHYRQELDAIIESVEKLGFRTLSFWAKNAEGQQAHVAVSAAEKILNRIGRPKDLAEYELKLKELNYKERTLELREKQIDAHTKTLEALVVNVGIPDNLKEQLEESRKLAEKLKEEYDAEG